MAYKPKKISEDLTASPVNVINAVRQFASEDYKSYVPYATPDADSIRQVGAILYDQPLLFNEFANLLYNQIGLIIFTSKQFYEHPWQFAIQGKLDFGETVEEIYVGLCEPYRYNPALAETNWMKREVPDVHAAFHPINYQHFYKSTIQRETLQKAFQNLGSLERFITEVIGSMYKSAQYDMFLALQYLLAVNIQNGILPQIKVDGYDTTEHAENTVESLRATSSLFESMLPNFTISGVMNFTPKSEQVLIINSYAEAKLGVKVLASAFNLSYVDYEQRRVTYPGFTYLDVDRLDKLFRYQQDDAIEGYHHFTKEELTALDKVAGVLVDEQFFQCYYRLLDSKTSPENGEGLYYNNWYHVWLSLGVSPFVNAVMFNSEEPAVSTVTVEPYTASLSVGARLPLSATVTTTGFASKAVTWTSDNPENVSVDSGGTITVLKAGGATITATSVADGQKTATCVVSDPGGE